MTGGYIGTMEAVSKGANEAGGTVIGVTCNEIESWRSVKPNEWITREIRFNTLNERIIYLIKFCDAAIALPGGIGTLAEIALTWNLLAVQAIQIPPMIVISSEWDKILRSFLKHMNEHIPEVHQTLITFCSDIEDAVNKIIEYKQVKEK